MALGVEDIAIGGTDKKANAALENLKNLDLAGWIPVADRAVQFPARQRTRSLRHDRPAAWRSGRTLRAAT
jgi:hypothetical protein